METLTIFLILLTLVLIFGLIATVFWLAGRRPRPDNSANEQLANLSGKLDAIQKQVDSNLSSVTSQVSTFGEVKETLGKVNDATERVLKLGEDVNKLQSILQANNRRGGFGEILLGNLLAQVLPKKHFCLQYAFKNKERVDAAIFLGERIMPIDSKFPLQGFSGDGASKASFARAVKDRMNESAKYIRPDEGTFEFAMMYIPAENVYYEIISDIELFNYGMQKRVIPVSPNSFFAYLQVVIYGLRGMQIEENARYIQGHLSSLKRSIEEIQDLYQKLGSSFTTTQNKYAEIDKKLGKFSSQIESLSAALEIEAAQPAVLADGDLVTYPVREQ